MFPWTELSTGGLYAQRLNDEILLSAYSAKATQRDVQSSLFEIFALHKHAGGVIL